VADAPLQEAPRHWEMGYEQADAFWPSHEPPQTDPSEAHA
jgi:hypothetical protein